MGNKLTTDKFIEILEENEFRTKFNFPKEANLEKISENTLNSIQKSNKDFGNELIQLNVLLNMYGISLQTYFDFIYKIACIDFTDKKYRDFLCDTYMLLFNEIDNYNISDSEKINNKIKIIEKAEREKRRSEIINSVGKVTTVVITVASAATIACKGMSELGQTKRYSEQMAMKAAKSKNFWNTIGKGLEVFGDILKES